MTISESENQHSQSEMQDQSPVPEKPDTPVLPVTPSKAPTFAYATGDPQEGNLATLVNSSNFTRSFINNLPAYRSDLSSFQKGLQIGVAHGYWLLGPFAAFGPLRDSGISLFAGLGATIGLIVVATLAIMAYAVTAPPPPIATLTTPNPPLDLMAPDGWKELARGFLIGGVTGAAIATSVLVLIALAKVFLLS